MFFPQPERRSVPGRRGGSAPANQSHASLSPPQWPSAFFIRLRVSPSPLPQKTEPGERPTPAGLAGRGGGLRAGCEKHIPVTGNFRSPFILLVFNQQGEMSPESPPKNPLPSLGRCLLEPSRPLLLHLEGSYGAGKGGEGDDLDPGSEGSRGNIQALNCPRVKKGSKRRLITPSCRSPQSPKGHQVTRARGPGDTGWGLGLYRYTLAPNPKAIITKQENTNPGSLVCQVDIEKNEKKKISEGKKKNKQPNQKNLPR